MLTPVPPDRPPDAPSLTSALGPPAPMSDDRAAAIVEACAAHVFYREGLLAAPPPSLAGYSLAELLEANHRVAARNGAAARGARPHTITTFCDDRLVAALYVAYHFDGDAPRACTPVAVACGRAVLVVTTAAEPADDDHDTVGRGADGAAAPSAPRPQLVR